MEEEKEEAQHKQTLKTPARLWGLWGGLMERFDTVNLRRGGGPGAGASRGNGLRAAVFSGLHLLQLLAKQEVDASSAPYDPATAERCRTPLTSAGGEQNSISLSHAVPRRGGGSAAESTSNPAGPQQTPTSDVEIGRSRVAGSSAVHGDALVLPLVRLLAVLDLQGSWGEGSQS